MEEISRKKFDNFSNAHLVPFYELHNYKIKEVTGIFVNGYNTILWSPVYDYLIRCTPKLLVYFEPIEILKKEYLGKDNLWIMPTISVMQSERTARKLKMPFSYIKEYQFDETNFEAVFADHKLFMENIGFPFFESVSTVEKIDKFLNEDAIFPNIMNSPEQIRKWHLEHSFFGLAIDALIAAKLANNPNLDILIDNYTKYSYESPVVLQYIEILKKEFLLK